MGGLMRRIFSQMATVQKDNFASFAEIICLLYLSVNHVSNLV
jgi:hypothetical protein